MLRDSTQAFLGKIGIGVRSMVNILARNAHLCPSPEIAESYFFPVFRGIFLRFVE